ncbi:MULTISPECIES: DNA polymerase I [Fusobacterium]|uniref:DNA polymerase I n=1 Tax=Fusobacterium TaxID=848 RepID=UPI001476980E|nr:MULTISPECIES: DNA polymerase I [Fusobacterium]NME35365.1 DNA polymerase I [Fusobacterium sp. FSA-380-WT-3A]
MKKIVLLDTSAIMYRAFYANMNFKTKDEPTGAVYGFTNTLLSIIKEFSPDYICAAQDVKRVTLKRSEIFEDYKKNREAIPEDLLVQIPRIEEVLDCFGIKRLKIDGYEADDVMGTIAKRFSKENYEIYIITGDKDLAQLVDENINIALMGKGDDGGFKILKTNEDVVEFLGVTPEVIPDLFGLIGDKSDGIPGVRKVGEKKAIPMLEKYQNLEGIYENISSLREIPGIGPGLIKNIEEDKEMAFLSRKLATIDKNIPLDIEISQISYNINSKKTLELFKALGFKTLIKRMNLEEAVEKIKEENKNSQLGLFENISEKEEIKKDEEIFIVDNDEKFEKLKENLKTEKEIFFYTENVGISFSTSKKDYYLPFAHNLKLGEKFQNYSKEKIQEIFNMDKKFVTYGFKNVIKNIGKISTKNMEFDMMLGYHLQTAQTKEGLEMVASNEGIDIKNYTEIFGKEERANTNIEEYGKYLCKMSALIQEVYPDMKEDLEEKGLMKNLKDTEIPLIEVLASMEQEGITIDPKYFQDYSIELTELIEKLENKIYEEASEKFNINSPKQLSEILFFKLNITPVKKTKSGYSTDVEVLETLKDRGEKIAEYILEYRKFTKLKSTYVDALLKVRDENNKIHTTFNQTGTATGRLSSSDPNLQNIPVKTDEGMKIREGFIAKEGNKLLGIDYSQIELRVLGEMSGDENLIEAYGRNADLHSLTARKIFDLKEDEEVSREERIIAKTINFSVIYGKTPFGLASELKITQGEAKEYIEKYFSEYPKVKEFEKDIIAEAEKKGYVETYFKRRRIIDGINSKNKNIKNQGERMAVNTVIQGTAAEIIKKAMIKIYNEIKNKDDIKMLLQVHDELIFEIKEEKVDYYREIIENIMKNSVDFKKVHLEVNSAEGKNWAEAK